jgi:release factor glutamine methyltransferase
VDLLSYAAQQMAERGVPDARVDAEILLAHVLGVPREKLLSIDLDRLPAKAYYAFQRLILYRAVFREPVAYLIGTAGFYGLELEVSKAVLIPRPATETLVEAALKRLPPGGRFADIGTGSGAIAIAVLANSRDATAVATDVSRRALAIARRNAKANGVARRVTFRRGSLMGPLGRERFDLILSNPPYVAKREFASLAPELKHEPRETLDGGTDGLRFIRRIVAGAPARLRPGGRLLVEIGFGQADRVRDIAFHSGFGGVIFHNDLEGIERVMEARPPKPV